MRMHTVGALVAASLSPIAAQVGPGLSAPQSASTFFAATNPVFAPFFQSNTGWYSTCGVPLAGTNDWYLCVALRNPAAVAGFSTGLGLGDLITGLYTPPGVGIPENFVPTTDAAGFNTNLGDRAFQVDATATTAIFERVVVSGPVGGTSTVLLQGVFLATRPSVFVNGPGSATVPFGTPEQVYGIRGLGAGFVAADPAVGTVNGQLKIFYLGTLGLTPNAAQQGIWMDDVFRTTGTNLLFSGSNPRLVAVPSLPGPAELHSPALIFGADGDVEGLFLAQGDRAASPQFSDMWLADDLDPSTPIVPVCGAPAAWQYNGTVLAGRFLASSGAHATYLAEATGAWLVGDDESGLAGLGGSGGPLDLTLGATAGSFALVALSLGYASVPVPVPSVFGQLGLDPATLVVAGLWPIGANGTTTLAIGNPANPAFSGTVMRAQAMAIEPLGALVFTNTTTLKL